MNLQANAPEPCYPSKTTHKTTSLLSIAQGLETQAYPETEIDLPSTQAMSSAQVMPQDEIILVDDDTQEANIPTPGEINNTKKRKRSFIIITITDQTTYNI